MLLAVDIGNTNIKLGVFRGGKLLHSWRISSDIHRTADEYALILHGLVSTAKGRIARVAIAGVVPVLEAAMRQCAIELTGAEPVVIDDTSPLGFTIGYHPPSDVGVDRLVDAAAAVERYRAPVVVVDFGTAVTLGVVDRRKVYLGGVIAPGLELAAESLFLRTAKLPLATLKAPRSAIGRSTLEAIRSGLVLGCAALVDGLLERVFEEMGGKATVVATGGVAALVAPHSRHIRRVDPDLTLDGIRIVAGRMRGKA